MMGGLYFVMCKKNFFGGPSVLPEQGALMGEHVIQLKYI